MAIESVSKRDPSDLSETEVAESSCSPPPSPTTSATSSQASAPPEPAVADLASKFPPGPTWQNLPVESHPPPLFAGCGANQGCADLDGRAVHEGQTSSDASANFAVTARRFAPYLTFGGKFEGDASSRGVTLANEGSGGFSTDLKATARTTMILPVANNETAQPRAVADPTRHPVLGEARAHVHVETTSATSSPVDGLLNAKSSASNPLLGFIAPDIDTDVQLAYELAPGSLHLDATVWGDKFPNAELFITDSAGSSLMLGEFQHSKSVEFGPLYVVRDAPRLPQHELINFRAEIPLDPEGNFAGSPAIQSK